MTQYWINWKSIKINYVSRDEMLLIGVESTHLPATRMISEFAILIYVVNFIKNNIEHRNTFILENCLGLAPGRKQNNLLFHNWVRK